MKFENTEVCGLERAIKASGYPKQKDDYSTKRATRLGSCKTGTGHDCYLKGIIVMVDITAPQYWWLQFQRYHFWHGREIMTDIVSSESKMHRMMSMDLEQQCNEYVTDIVKNELKKIIDLYNNYETFKGVRRVNIEKKELFQMIIANCPMGLELKAAVTFNYLQIKSMYLQRYGHKLKEWQPFKEWAEGLPMFNEIVLGEKENECSKEE